MIIAMLLISALAGLALGFVYEITKEPIRKAQVQKQNSALKGVLPEFDDVQTSTVTIGDETLEISKALFKGELVGTAVKTYSMQGYGGKIQLMVGFLPNGDISKIEVLEHKETPGLGSKMAEEPFIGQFSGKNPATTKMIVKKDNGDIDAISGATISSRAFCDAVERAYDALPKGE